jgi:hypothetical protein
MSLTHVFFAEPGGVVVTVRLNDEPSGFETEPETWVEPNKCKLLCNRLVVEVQPRNKKAFTLASKWYGPSLDDDFESLDKRSGYRTIRGAFPSSHLRSAPSVPIFSRG